MGLLNMFSIQDVQSTAKNKTFSPIRSVNKNASESWKYTTGILIQQSLSKYDQLLVLGYSFAPKMGKLYECDHPMTETNGAASLLETWPQLLAVRTQVNNITDQALATAMHAMQTTVAPTLISTPGALALSRDVFWTYHVLTIGRQFQHDANNTSMLISTVQVRSNVNMTMLRIRKFWRCARPN